MRDNTTIQLAFQQQYAATGASLPARLKAEQAAMLLGFAPADIPVLVRKKLLKPLGDPRPQATKYFAKIEILRISLDQSWLAKATQAIYKHWLSNNKNKSPDLRDAA